VVPAGTVPSPCFNDKPRVAAFIDLLLELDHGGSREGWPPVDPGHDALPHASCEEVVVLLVRCYHARMGGPRCAGGCRSSDSRGLLWGCDSPAQYHHGAQISRADSD
jgi:hypothetical protein